MGGKTKTAPLSPGEVPPNSVWEAHAQTALTSDEERKTGTAVKKNLFSSAIASTSGSKTGVTRSTRSKKVFPAPSTSKLVRGRGNAKQFLDTESKVSHKNIEDCDDDDESEDEEVEEEEEEVEEMDGQEDDDDENDDDDDEDEIFEVANDETDEGVQTQKTGASVDPKTESTNQRDFSKPKPGRKRKNETATGVNEVVIKKRKPKPDQKIIGKGRAPKSYKSKNGVKVFDLSMKRGLGKPKDPLYIDLGDGWFLQYAYHDYSRKTMVGLTRKKGKDVEEEWGWGVAFSPEIIGPLMEALPLLAEHLKKTGCRRHPKLLLTFITS